MDPDETSTSWCLICCSAFSTRNESTPTANNDHHKNSLTKTKIAETISKYLHVPKEHLVMFKQTNYLSFCPNCLVFVDEIIELQKKAQILELQIQTKMETLGRMAITSKELILTRRGESNQKKVLVKEVLETFKARVAQNFRQGLLPNPSVILENPVNKNNLPSSRQKSKSKISKRVIRDDDSSSNDWSLYSIRSDEVINTQADENMEEMYYQGRKNEYPKDADDSSDDQYECVIVSATERTNRKDKNMNESESNKITSETFQNFLQTAHPQEEKDECNTSNLSDPPTPIESNEDTGSIEDNSSSGGYKRKREDDSGSDWELDNAMKRMTYERKMKLSKISKTKSQVRPVKCQRVQVPDYCKCTKCDYFVKNKNNAYSKLTPRSLRIKLAAHYSRYHNPVPARDYTRSNIDGKYNYRCTKCSFLITFKKEAAYPAVRRRLSIHYMEVHDDVENRWKCSCEETLSSLAEGVDYFVCPIPNCTCVEFITREKCQKEQLKNATEARLRLIEHFKTSNVHTEDLENCEYILFGVKNNFEFKPATSSFYKCTKCDFKSVIGECDDDEEDIPLAKLHSYSREKAQNTLISHYLNEHLFSWEKFPGFYKYRCYEETCQDGTVLTCPYSDCGYFMKIQYDLEGKNEEECKLASYQAFVDNHSSKHSFNSRSFYNNNKCLLKSGSDTCASASNGQDIQQNGDVDDSASDSAKNLQLNGTVYDTDEIPLNHLVSLWNGEEMNQTATDSHESIVVGENYSEVNPIEHCGPEILQIETSEASEDELSYAM